MKIDTSELLYKVFTIINTIVPKSSKSIFIYDGPYMRQNCWALLKYLADNQYNDQYKITYYTNKQIKTKYKGVKNVFITSSLIKGAVARVRSKFIFFEYNNYKFNAKRHRNQVSFNIWHGMLIKKIGYLAGNKPQHPYENDYTYVLTTADYFHPYIKSAFNLSDDQLYTGGYPRNDFLKCEKPNSKHIWKGWKNYLWMPTFRKSTKNGLIDTEVELPIVTEKNIDELDFFLAANRVHIIIKSHPFQDRIEWLQNSSYQSITVLSNTDIFGEGFELYEFVSQVDGLITDYSSIIFDFLLTGKPILVAMDDFEDYKKNRGIVDETVYERLNVPIASDIEMFKTLIVHGMISKDLKEIKKLQDIFCNTSHSGSFSKDIIDFLNIPK